MLQVLQIVTTLVLSVAMTMSLAHALEFPGKMSLSKEDYFAVQKIYYPGFTYAGATEPVAIILLGTLLFFTPRGTSGFWLTTLALLGATVMHAVYWLVTHPVNRAWVTGVELSKFGSGFFTFGSEPQPDLSWTRLRDRWEYSHIARACLALVALAALITSLRL